MVNIPTRLCENQIKLFKIKMVNSSVRKIYIFFISIRDQLQRMQLQGLPSSGNRSRSRPTHYTDWATEAVAVSLSASSAYIGGNIGEV